MAGAAGRGAPLLLGTAQLGDAPATIADVARITLIQWHTANVVLGRVDAGMRLVGAAGSLLGSLAAGPAAAVLGTGAALLCACAVGVGGALLLLATPVGAARGHYTDGEAGHCDTDTCRCASLYHNGP